MSTKPSEKKMSVAKHIPITQLINNIQYDIYINLETELRRELRELSQFRPPLTSSQSQNTHMNPRKIQILDIYDKIYKQFELQLEDVIKTKEKIENKKTEFFPGVTPRAVTPDEKKREEDKREEENQKTREAILMANKDFLDYTSQDYHNRIWREQMLVIINETLSDLEVIESEVKGNQSNFFDQAVFSNFNLYNMNETTEVCFLMYYAQEWLLKILYRMFTNGTANYPQDPNKDILNLPPHKFIIFNENITNHRLLPQIINDFDNLVEASGGGKKIKSKSNLHSRRTKIKTKKQSKQKKSKKSKKYRK